MASRQRIRYPEVAPAGVAAMSAVEHYLNVGESLPAVLLELVRLRCSLLNGCEYCIAMHSHELSKHNEPETRVQAVGRWRTSDAFTARERAALRWAECITDIQHGHAQDVEFEAVRQHFNEEELVNLTIAIGSINAFNRMAIAFRPQWHGNPGPSGSEQARSPNANATPADPASQPEGHQDRDGTAEPARNDTRDAVGDDGGKVSEE